MAMVSYAPFYFRERFGFSTAYASYVVIGASVFFILGTRICGSLVSRYGRKSMMLWPTILAAASIFVYLNTQNVGLSLAASLIPTHITVEANTDPMRVNLDRVKMRRVMDNLIRNATEAKADGGTLTITTRENKHGTTIEVSDTGTGIPENEMENLFKPFYTTKPHGVGLGLTYCKRTVEAHKGTIEAESRSGEGTRITITIPKTP
jgi:signal transduction histidine kinase